jgi:acetate---CoA ligase (ADP-forming)
MAAANNALRRLRDIEAVAVVGASERPGLTANASRALRDIGFGGRIYYVNPHRDAVFGEPAYKSVRDLPERPQAAIVAVPPAAVEGVLDECGAAGVGVVVVMSAGFGEGRGSNRFGLETLRAAAQRSGICLIGPNCIGVADIPNQIALWGASRLGSVRPGPVTCVAQSGTPLLAVTGDVRRIGCRYLANTGNEADVDVSGIMLDALDDEGTAVLAIYLEQARAPESLIRAFRIAEERGVPVVALKGGRTASGRSAAVAHTASLAGSADVYRGVFRQFGVIEAADLDEWLNVVALGASWRPMSHLRIAVITGSGGCMVMMADVLEEMGLAAAELSAQTRARLDDVLPDIVSARNPLDLSLVGLSSPQTYEAAMAALVEDPNVDALCAYLPIPNDGVADALARLAVNGQKPLAVVLAQSSQPIADTFVSTLAEARIPLLLGTRSATRALRLWLDWSRRRDRSNDRRASALRGPAEPHRDLPRNGDQSFGHDDGLRRALSRCGIQWPRELRFGRIDELPVGIFGQGARYVLKAAAPDLAHKTEVGGVAFDITDEQRLGAALAEMTRQVRPILPPGVPLAFALQEHISADHEIIVGVRHDPDFGLIILVGIGGVLTEVIRDAQIRRYPLAESDVVEMLDDLGHSAVLDGFRGREPVDKQAIARAVTLLADLMHGELSPQIDAIEINPLLVSGSRMWAVDLVIEHRAAVPDPEHTDADASLASRPRKAHGSVN